MAKITGGLLSLGAGGTVAKTLTFSRWKGQPYVRQRVVPANPQTTDQTLTRSVFSEGSNVWKNAPALFVDPWNLFATGQVLTGRNAMIGSYVRILREQLDLSLMQFSPGAKGGTAAQSVTAVGGANQITVTVVPPVPPTGWTVAQVEAAALQDGPPDALPSYSMAAGFAAADPWEVVLGGLLTATNYAVGGWIKWTRPDGTFAYGPSETVLELTL